MHHDAIEIDDRPDGIELPVAPCRYLCIQVSRDFRDQGRRHVNAVELVHNFLDVPSGHPLGVKSQNFLVEPSQPALVFGDELWLEGAIAVAWRCELDLAQITLHRFLRMPIATIIRAL